MFAPRLGTTHHGAPGFVAIVPLVVLPLTTHGTSGFRCRASCSLALSVLYCAREQLKAVLSGRVEEVEARIEGVAREMRALHEAQRQRRSAEQDEMDALAARKQSLDDEESDCTQVCPGTTSRQPGTMSTCPQLS